MTKAVLGLMLILGLVGFGTGRIISHQQERDGSVPKKEDPTPITQGVMTDQQKEHAKLYKRSNPGRNLAKMSAAKAGPVEVILGQPWGLEESGYDSNNFSQYLQDISCDADVVVLGVIRGKSSQLTEDADFVFTDYEMAVEDVLKDNSADHISPQSAITITRRGGTVQLNGHVIRALDKAFRSLEVNSRYVLFLKYLPTTHTYQGMKTDTSYLLSNNKVTEHAEQPLAKLPQGIGEEAMFIAQVRAAIAAPCKSK